MKTESRSEILPKSQTSSFLKIHLQDHHSFNIRRDVVPYFYNKFHYHPEIELIYIVKGSGRQFIGESVFHFKEGDMMMVGANVPHLWWADEKYFEKDSTEKMEAIVLHFREDCFGEHFFKLPENADIAKLIYEWAPHAVRIKEKCQKQVLAMMHELLIAKDSMRIILLMQILHEIAVAPDTDKRTICEHEVLFYKNARHDGTRMNQIYQYILNNFHHEISLEEIAKVAHMAPNAFCRYFKSRIKKTFSSFLMEVRVGHAAKLLAQTQKSVADICFESGFNNFSNFNKHFKQIVGKTPMQHRKYYYEQARSKQMSVSPIEALHP